MLSQGIRCQVLVFLNLVDILASILYYNIVFHVYPKNHKLGFTVFHLTMSSFSFAHFKIYSISLLSFFWIFSAFVATKYKMVIKLHNSVRSLNFSKKSKGQVLYLGVHQLLEIQCYHSACIIDNETGHQ